MFPPKMKISLTFLVMFESTKSAMARFVKGASSISVIWFGLALINSINFNGAKVSSRAVFFPMTYFDATFPKLSEPK